MMKSEAGIEPFARFVEVIDPWLGETVLVGGWAHRLYRKEVLAEEGVVVEIAEIAVHDMVTAKTLQFCGSPTIRINGRDVAAELGTVQDFAVSCRLYPGSKEPGVPPTEMIRRAVLDARTAENR